MPKSRRVKGPATHLSVESIRGPEKAVDESIRRVSIHLIRRPDLFNAARIDHYHAVGDLERLFLVMRHEHTGDAEFVVQATQPATQILAHLGIERPNGSSRSRTRGSPQAPEPMRPAGAARPKADPDNGRSSSRSVPVPVAVHPLPDFLRRVAAPTEAGRAARRQRCRTRSYAGTVRSAGRRIQRFGSARRGRSCLRPAPEPFPCRECPALR